VKSLIWIFVMAAAGGLKILSSGNTEPAEFSGIFTDSYEERIFYPCGGLPGPAGWWVRFSPGVTAPHAEYTQGGPGLPTISHYMRVRGSLSAPGSYGTGFHSRELLIDSVLEIGDTTTCHSAFDKRPTRWDGAGAAHPIHTFAATSEDRSLVAIADNTGIVTVWRHGEQIAHFRYSTPAVNGGVPTTTVLFSQSNRLMAVGTGDGWVRVWSLPRRRLLWNLDHSTHTDSIGFPNDEGRGIFVGAWPVNSMAFSSDDSFLVTAGGARAFVWSLTTGRKLASLPGPGKRRAFAPSQIAMLRNPDRIIGLGRDGTIRVYSLNGGSPQFVASGPIVDLLQRPMKVSPDQKFLAIRIADDSVAVWSLDEGRFAYKLGVPTFLLEDFAFSPDSKFIAMSASHYAIYVWETANGKPFTRLRAPYGGAHNLWFTEKGDSIIMRTFWEPTLSVIPFRYSFDTFFNRH
jgi:WD40 repeat protein